MRHCSASPLLLLIFTSATHLLPGASTSLFSFVQAIEPSLNSSAAFTPNSSIPKPSGTPGTSKAAGDRTTKMFAFPVHKKEDISAFAGKIAPVLSKLYITPEKATNIWLALKTVTEPADLIFIAFIGWLLLPLVQFPYEKLPLKLAQKEREEDDVIQSSPSKIQQKKKIKLPFLESKVYFYTHLLSEAARIAAFVYSMDCLAIAMETLGFHVQYFSKYAAKVTYTAWIFVRINALRKYLIKKAFRYSGPDEKRRRRAVARAKVVNRVLDITTWGLFLISLLDVLKVEAGMFLNSFFAVGGAGTLVLSFASKDVAMQFVNGILLQASDKVVEGDTVKFGNVIQGVVMRVGLLESLVKHDGELLTAVPNRDLANQRLTNLSRLKYAQVTQTLRFGFKDARLISEIIQEIRKEIRETCPHVVTNGTRPFRIFLSNYGDYALEVTVDVRMSIPPVGDQFFQGRQDVLLAINRALTRLDVELVACGVR